MGGQAWQSIRQQTPPLKDGEVREFVHGVADRLVAASPEASKEKWDLQVFDSEQPNAFALPGGHIGIYSGILPIAENEAGLAAVVAHELGHVLAEHANQRVSQQLLAQTALSGASIALGGAENRGLILGALGLGAQVGVMLPFNRDQEQEADEIGMRMMAQAGYAPEESIELWKRMKAKAGGQQTPGFLSTHPAPDDRIENLKKMLPETLAIYRKSETKLDRGQSVPATSLAGRAGSEKRLR